MPHSGGGSIAHVHAEREEEQKVLREDNVKEENLFNVVNDMLEDNILLKNMGKEDRRDKQQAE